MIKFNKRDSKKMLKEVARLRGVSVAEVREEMQLAIEEARNNPDERNKQNFKGCLETNTNTRGIYLYYQQKAKILNVRSGDYETIREAKGRFFINLWTV